jgi:phosphoribosylformimino-5-aminoimidazole carboxamide ribonucleotide (ProFAR) isomerase
LIKFERDGRTSKEIFEVTDPVLRVKHLDENRLKVTHVNNLDDAIARKPATVKDLFTLSNSRPPSDARHSLKYCGL